VFKPKIKPKHRGLLIPRSQVRSLPGPQDWSVFRLVDSEDIDLLAPAFRPALELASQRTHASEAMVKSAAIRSAEAGERNHGRQGWWHPAARDSRLGVTPGAASASPTERNDARPQHRDSPPLKTVVCVAFANSGSRFRREAGKARREQPHQRCRKQAIQPPRRKWRPTPPCGSRRKSPPLRR
jgi:hypothetical protein